MANKFVNFQLWCNKCKHKNNKDTDDPCNDCLNYPVNEDSTKPVDFSYDEEKENEQNRKT